MLKAITTSRWNDCPIILNPASAPKIFIEDCLRVRAILVTSGVERLQAGDVRHRVLDGDAVLNVKTADFGELACGCAIRCDELCDDSQHFRYVEGCARRLSVEQYGAVAVRVEVAA